jgi:hypothetical protein
MCGYYFCMKEIVGAAAFPREREMERHDWLVP